MTSSNATGMSTSLAPSRGWMVRRRIVVPNYGFEVYGEGSLWVVDGDHGEMNGDQPLGNLDKVDPATGRVLDSFPHVVGGFPAVGFGSVWLCTIRDNLDVVTRFDIATHHVTRIKMKTRSSRDPEPESIAIAHEFSNIRLSHPRPKQGRAHDRGR